MSDDTLDPEPPEDAVNAADPASIERARRKGRFTDEQRAAFWKAVLSSDIGRKVMWETMRALGTFEDRFGSTPAGMNCPEMTWLYAGEQRAGQRIYHTLLKHDHLALHQMHVENDPAFIRPKPARAKKD